MQAVVMGEMKSEAQNFNLKVWGSKSTGGGRQTLEDNINIRLKKEWIEWLKIRGTGEVFGCGNNIGVTYILGHLLTTRVCVNISATSL
jgi:hypothetical protein